MWSQFVSSPLLLNTDQNMVKQLPKLISRYSPAAREQNLYVFMQDNSVDRSTEYIDTSKYNLINFAFLMHKKWSCVLCRMLSYFKYIWPTQCLKYDMLIVMLKMPIPRLKNDERHDA